MVHLCAKCGKLIEDFDEIVTTIAAVYHPLKSSITYALDKDSLEVIGSLVHKDCHEQN